MRTTVALIFSAIALVACNKAPEPAPVAAAPAAGSAVPYDVSLTIKEVMEQIVAPTSGSLWQRVMEVASAKGVEKIRPKTPEEWAAAVTEASILIETGNALRLPERIKLQQVDENDHDWEKFANSLSTTAKTMRAAAMAQNPDQLFDTSMALDEVCDTCHDKYLRGGDEGPKEKTDLSKIGVVSEARK